MQNATLETQSPEKDKSSDTLEKTPAEPQPDADSTDAVWTEEMMQWAIASSTCGGLPRKDDEDVDKENKDSNGEKPACP